MPQGKVLSSDDVEALARSHADLEERGDFERLMSTLVARPVYEYHPLGVQLRGADAILRYYQRVRARYNPYIEDSELVELIAGTSGAVLEYAIRLRINEVTVDDRLIAVMPVKHNLFTGERIYSSERVLRLLLGEMIDEVEEIPSFSTLVPPTRNS